jgi:hypothetical protein
MVARARTFPEVCVVEKCAVPGQHGWKGKTMKEKTRQSLLRAIGWRKADNDGAGVVVVFVPKAVCAVAGRPYSGATLDDAIRLGATRLRAEGGQIVADWPQFPFAIAAYLDREFSAAGFEFRPDAWFTAAAAAGKVGKLVKPSIPDRAEYHPTSLLVNEGLADWQ